MNRIFKLVLILLIIMSSSSVFAWGTTGHRVVAEIAERHLTKKAKKNIHRIIGNQSLAYWANWPDFIKSDDSWKRTYSWHYVNLSEGLDYQGVLNELNNSTTDHLYKSTLFLVDELKTKELSIETQQEYLYFIIHLIGDAHQPLHIGRAEDLGGNKISLQWFGSKTNLHSLWDSKMIDFDKYSYTEYASVLDIYDTDINKKWMEGNLEDWLFDSYLQANKIYAGVKTDQKLSYRYHYSNKYTVENQLLKAGLRLSKVLNSIFG